MKIAILGAGRIFKKHWEAIQHFKGSLKCVGVCDDQPLVRERLVQQLGVPVFSSLEEMLEKTHPHIVTILTPSGLHAAHAITAARAGCHVIVEKPMALTVKDADAMIHTCDRFGVKLFVVKQNRFNEPVQRARVAFEKGLFGKMALLTVRVRWSRDQAYYDSAPWRGTWALDGGVLANQAAHHVDLLQWFGGEVVSVYGRAGTYGSQIEVEDTAVGILRFQSGALGVIEATTAVRPYNLEGSFSLLGEKGSVVIGGTAVNQLQTWSFVDLAEASPLEKKGSHRQEGERCQDREKMSDVYGEGHLLYYQNVLESLAHHRKGLIDGLEGRKTLEIMSAFYESVETASEVVLRFIPKKCRLGLGPT